MGPWTVTSCTVSDAADLARNNMSAFWEDPTWILLWPRDFTREYVIEQCAKRMPRSLLRDRATLRHQKAVDPETGAIVGYARWILPPGRAVKATGEAEWGEAQVPDVSVDEREGFERLFRTADWNTRDDMDALDDKNHVVMNRIRSEKPYISLDYLAVHPDNKGKGVATALVESGIRAAEEMGVDIFMLAFKAGLGVYKRLGFQEVERIIQDDSKYGGKGEYGAYFLIYHVNKPE
ncbi:acyl-CoA N-acyltransferase [Phialemonium atrogriseum]|uniref:Acyl-CoA N-acyltransferase n=1 Tax=Phialemonium atrogriseum TaxID=1093897 RepID=A0AAJ0FF51_9PEZI|nr:acyl-CoA N-acyltransferase [Phialemonium atrogriseum]KAK1765087.1 acyl-CoA N-acyltransferase [Phialemonium atrogriseum]